jgi:C-terminal processing protease CtpA/Prc
MKKRRREISCRPEQLKGPEMNKYRGAALAVLAIAALSAAEYSYRNSTLRVKEENAAGIQSTLPADVRARLEKLDIETREKLLSDEYFTFAIKHVPEPIRPRYLDLWLKGLEDNFCREILYEAASRAYDVEGVGKLDLPNAQAGCPKGVSVEKTREYVNGRLKDAFDDPFTFVMEPAAGRQLITRLSGKEKLDGGVGLVFTNVLDSEQTLIPGAGAKTTAKFTGLVYHAVKSGPSRAAGIQDGDKVLKVDGNDVIGLDSDYVIESLLRGPKGSSSTLTVDRGGSVFETKIVRAEIHPDSVWLRDLGDGLFAIIVTQWDDGSAGNIYAAVAEAKAAGARGIVIDVRNNVGGNFLQAVAAAAIFVKDGLLVSTRERELVDGHPESEHFHLDRYEMRNGRLWMVSKEEDTGKLEEQEVSIQMVERDPSTGKARVLNNNNLHIPGLPPVVVIGNGWSASASEVFIGSVSKNRMGKGAERQGAGFIGRETAGKGIEQENSQLALGMRFSVTFGRYFLNDGSWPGDAHRIRNPIVPDLAVTLPERAVIYTPDDSQLNAAVHSLKSTGK